LAVASTPQQSPDDFDGPAAARAVSCGSEGSVPIEDLDINVQVYRGVPRYFAVYLLGNGKPRTLIAHNVSAYWTGHDSRAVEAAMKELR
jgi:hypothetical protein